METMETIEPVEHRVHDLLIGNPQHLRRVFANDFTAADIASPLLSFDSSFCSAEAARILERKRSSVAGVRIEGQMQGYVVRADLGDGSLDKAMRPFEPSVLVTGDTSLSRVITTLNDQEQIFVTSFNTVVAVITRSDAEKPAVRMWLFGVITLLEMTLSRAIAMRFPDGSWTELLSPGRLVKATQLCEERKRIGLDADLLSFLQLSDIGGIFMKDPQLRALTKHTSRSQGENAFKKLAQLRDHLAHAQPIVQHNWLTIAGLSEVLDRTLEYLDRTMQE